MSETNTEAGEKPAEGQEQQGSFTQADVDAAVEKIAAKIRAEERRKVSEKYADYDDLKAKAGKATTAEERIASLEQEVQSTKREAMRRRVQAAHSISDEDADLFLTGTDEETLTSQAKRLAARESERKKQGNYVPREGNTSEPGQDDVRKFANDLFGRALSE